MNASILTTPQWMQARTATIHQFMASELKPLSKSLIGQRLRLTREAMGLTQKKFAEMAGMSPTAYNQWETGENMPGLVNAVSLRKAHGLTLDWIFLGDMAGLSTRLSDAIRALDVARAPAMTVHNPKKSNKKIA